MENKILIEKISGGLWCLSKVLIIICLAIMLLSGFVFSSVALALEFKERGSSTAVIGLPCVIIIFILKLALVLMIIGFAFELTKKYLVPALEKTRKKRMEKFKVFLKEVVREELNSRRRRTTTRKIIRR